MLSSSHPSADGTLQGGVGIEGSGVLLIPRPQCSLSQSITICMSETNDADGAAAAPDLAIAVIASRCAMQHGGRKPDEGVVLAALAVAVAAHGSVDLRARAGCWINR